MVIRIRHAMCVLVALSTLLVSHSAVLGANPNALRGDDVALQANGELRGQILDQQGRPQALTKVAIVQNQKAVAYAKTDIAGEFAVRGLKPGAYQIHSEVGTKSVRVWAPRTAPPVAQQAVLIVADGNVARAKIDHANKYGPAIRGAIAGGLLTGGAYYLIDHNDEGS